MKTYASIAVIGLLLGTPALADDQSSAGIHSGVNSGGATAQGSIERLPNTAAGAGTGGAMSGGSSAAADQSATLPRTGGERTGDPGAGTSMSPSAIEQRPSPTAEDEQMAATRANKSATSSDMSHNKGVVRQVQTELSNQGYKIGKVDGVMGKNTRQALTKYQKEHGIKATGRIDQNTLAKMDIQPQQASKPGMSDQSR